MDQETVFSESAFLATGGGKDAWMSCACLVCEILTVELQKNMVKRV